MADRYLPDYTRLQVANRTVETEMGGGAHHFQPTLWTVVLAAKDVDSSERRNALNTLIQAYWKPLYCFLLRRTGDSEKAKDITQGFLTALVDHNTLKYLRGREGRFRTFLLTALEHYLVDDYRREQALKRGGGKKPLDIDLSEVESSVQSACRTQRTPEHVYNREWAVRVLAQALSALRDEFAASGRQVEFEILRSHVSYQDSRPNSAAEAAAALGTSESDVKNKIRRIRSRYREAILDVVRSYMDGEADIREELNELFSALQR